MTKSTLRYSSKPKAPVRKRDTGSGTVKRAGSIQRLAPGQKGVRQTSLPKGGRNR